MGNEKLMSNNNDFGDIQENFEYIADALDSIRAQNAMNAGNSDKVLTSINSRLETLADEENSNLIKLYLTELKKNLEERHNFVSAKFSQIESAFSELFEKAESQLKASEIKEVFEIIATNLNTFSKDFSSQKELISEVGLKLEELQQDDSQNKKEVLKNISTLKVELEKFGNGFESIILNLNGNFKEVSQAMAKLDTSDSLSGLKKDIDNVFLSSNAILSTLQVIDRKNRELEEVITHVVTKEDFNVEREQVAKLIVQNVQLTEYISTLPTKENLETLTGKVDTSVGVINALKNMITESGKQNQQLLTAQLDNLESKILNISTEEEFIGFRKELSQFAQEVIQSTNLMRTDLATTNSDLKELSDYFAAMDIKNTFTNFSALTKVTENNIIESISSLSENVTDQIGKNRNLTSVDIEDSITAVSGKIDAAKTEISENTDKNSKTILEHLQSVVNNIFSVKNALHVENLEAAEAIDNKIKDLKDNLTTSNNYIVETSQENLERVLANVERVFDEVAEVKSNLGDTATHTFKNLGNGFNDISKRIDEIKNELNQNSQESFSNLLSIVEDFSQEILALKTSINETAQDGSAELKEVIEGVSNKLASVQDSMIKTSDFNSSELKSSIEALVRMTQNIKTTLEQSSSIGFSGIKANIEDLSLEIKNIEESFDIKAQTNLSKIVVLFEDLTNEVNANKNFLSESTQVNFETVSLYIQNLTKKMEESKENLNEELRTSFSDLQNTIYSLPETIRGNQIVFENEKKSLIEENSKNIEEVGNKVQNLIMGLVAKENPFKGEVLYEFAQLQKFIQTIKDDVGQANLALGENVEGQISSNLQTLSESINEYSERYNNALFGLQNKIVEYFSQIQQANQESDLKIESSIKEAIETKTEVKSILESLSEIKEDSSISQLSSEMSRKIEGILLNITQLEEILSSKNKSSADGILGLLEDKFEKVSAEIKGYQNLSTEEMGDYVADLADKIETIKSQISLANTDVINILSAKNDDLAVLLKPIENSVDRLNSIDFEELSGDIKNKIDTSAVSVTSLIREDIKIENEEQLEKIARDFSTLSEKLDHIISRVSADNAEEIDGLKNILHSITHKIDDNEFFVEQFASFKESVKGTLKDAIGNSVFELKTQSNQNASAINDILQLVLTKIEERELYSHIETFANTTQQAIIDKLDTVEDNLLLSQDETKTMILDDVLRSQSESKTEIINELTRNNIQSKTEILEELKEDYKNATEEILSRSNEKFAQLKDSVEDKILSESNAIGESISETKTEIIEGLKEDYKLASQELLFDSIEKFHDIQNKLLQGQKSTENTLLEELTSLQNGTKAAIMNALKEELQEGLSSNKDEFELSTHSAISRVIDATNERIFEKFEQLQEELAIKIQTESKSIGAALEETSAAINSTNADSKSEIIEEITRNQSVNKSEMVYEIVHSQKETIENAKSEILGGLKEDYKTAAQAFLANSTETFDQLREDVSSKVQAECRALNDAVGNTFENSLSVANTELLKELKEEYMDSAQDLLSSASEKFEQLQEGVSYTVQSECRALGNSLEDAFERSVSSSKTGLLEELKEEYKNSTLELISESRGNLEEVQEKILEGQRDSETTLLEEISQLQNTAKLSILEAVKEELQEGLSSDREDLRLSTQTSVSKIIDAANERIFEKFELLQEEVDAKIEAECKTIAESINENAETANATRSEIKQEIIDEILQAQNENKTAAVDEIIQSHSEISAEIKTEIINELKDEYKASAQDLLSESIEKIETLQEKMIQVQREAKTELSGNITQAQNEIETAILSELQENITFIKDLMASIKPDDALTEALSQKIETIETKITESSEEYKTSTQSLLSDVKISFYEKVDDSIDELRSFIEILENKEDFSTALAGLKSDMFDKFTEISESVDISINSISVKKDLEEVNEQIKGSIDNLFEGIEEKFISSLESSDTINGLNDKSEEVNRRVEELKKLITDDLNEKLDEFELSFDTQNKDFTSLIEDLKTSLSELKENYVDLSLNSTMEMSSLLMGVQEKVEAIESKFDNLDFSEITESVENKLESFDFNSAIEDTKKEIKETLTGEISEKISASVCEELSGSISETISKELEAFNEKIEAISPDIDTSELEKEIREIKQIVQSQIELVEGINNDDISTEVQKVIEIIEKKLDSFSIELPEIQEKEINTDEIINELNTFKEEVLAGVIDIFNQLSFVEEAEDIKDFIAQQANETKVEIKNSLKSSLGNNFDDILSNLESLHEKTGNVDYNCSNLISEIQEVKKNLIKSQNEIEGDSGYSYTLQDVESDIAKVRMILNDLASVKTDAAPESSGDFEKLNETIMSLSTRTNKILLTSDESHNELRSNLDAFRNVVYQFEEKIKYLDNKETISKIDNKLEKVNNLMLSSVKSDKIFNQTFMYLAEWVDSASENLGTIIEKVSEVDSVKKSVADLKNSLPKKQELESILDAVNEKFEQQEDKISSLEDKLDKVLSLLSEKPAKADPKADPKIAKKVDSIEKQLTKLTKGVEKLTSYVDEE